MKIGIITLHTVDNYGSVLQTYATQQIFRGMGYETEVIDYWRKNNLPQSRAEMQLTSDKMQKLKSIWGICSLTKYMTVKLLQWRLEYFKSPMRTFLLKHVTITPKRYLSFAELKENPPEADIYVTGSDQVWNSIWNEGIELPYFLEFAPAGKPRIAFSASIGRERIDEEEFFITQKLLSKYTAISVREQSAVDLLQQMGLEAYLMLDPTLMLPRNEWRKISQYQQVTDRQYLLIYQLNSNPEMDAYAVKLAEKRNWDILRIGFGRSDKNKSGCCIRLPSIPKLLGLFDKATMVLTDSFHATAFSLNFGRDFISVPPPRFSTRLESILQLTQTKNRMLQSYDDFSLADQKMDKEKVKQILDAKRAEGMAWLKNALAKGEKK